MPSCARLEGLEATQRASNGGVCLVRGSPRSRVNARPDLSSPKQAVQGGAQRHCLNVPSAVALAKQQLPTHVASRSAQAAEGCAERPALPPGPASPAPLLLRSWLALLRARELRSRSGNQPEPAPVKTAGWNQ